ncbi:hypothetical protein D9M71_669950 [compost metagenome]
MGLAAQHFQGAVSASAKQRRLFGTQAQRARNQGLLDAPVTPVRPQLGQVNRLLQRLLAAGVIDRLAVIRIDQAEVPEVIALIKVRHPRHCHAQQSLRQTVEGTGCGD